MKKKLLLFSIGLAVLQSMAENSTMFVHHDDDIDIFLYASIDSMRVSSIDIDSIDIGKPIVQEIWTSDSVYRYNIADIDSITFQTPPTIAAPGAIDLDTEDYKAYILGYDETDGLVLKMSVNTPDKLVPLRDNCLYQISPSSALPYGFAAKVSEVHYTSDFIAVKCTDVDPDEIFEQIAWTADYVFDPASEVSDILNVPSSRTDYDPEYWLVSTPEYPDLVSGAISMTDELRDIPLGPPQAQIKSHIGIHPLVTCQIGNYVLKTEHGRKIRQTKMRTTSMTSVKASAQGRQIIDKSHTTGSDNKLTFNLPMGLGQKCTLTYVGTMTLKGSMGLDFNYSSSYRSVINTTVIYDDDAAARVESNCTHTPTSGTNVSLDASFVGNLSLIGTLSITNTQVGDSLKSVTHSVSYGASLRGDALYKTSEHEKASTDNSLYRRITSTGIYVKPIESVAVTAKYKDQKLKPKMSIGKPDSTAYFVVPKFTTVEYDPSTHIARYDITGVPMHSSSARLGVAVKNDNGYTYSSTDYVWPKDTKTMFMANIDFNPSKDEILYPTVTMPSGERILAAPQYPNVDNCIFPITSVGEASGVRITSGAPIIGSAKSNDNKTIVIIGNMLLIKQSK